MISAFDQKSSILITKIRNNQITAVYFSFTPADNVQLVKQRLSELAKALTQCTSVTDLSILYLSDTSTVETFVQNSDFTNEIIGILTVIQNNPTLLKKLQSFQVVGNIGTNVVQQIAVKIAELLRDSRSLIRLNLSGVNIGDQGISVIAKVLPNSSLIHLGLYNNNITDCSADLLSQAIATSKLEYVMLGRNKFTSNGLSHFAGMIGGEPHKLESFTVYSGSEEEHISIKQLEECQATINKFIKASISHRILAIQAKHSLQLKLIETQLGLLKPLSSNEISSSNVVVFSSPLMRPGKEYETAKSQLQITTNKLQEDKFTSEIEGKTLYLTIKSAENDPISTIQEKLLYLLNGVKTVLGSTVIAKTNIADTTLSIKTHNPQQAKKLAEFLSGVIKLSSVYSVSSELQNY